MTITLFFLLLMATHDYNAAGTPDERVAHSSMIAPGAPPALSFRYYEGKLHHRFGNAELLLDDAGH